MQTTKEHTRRLWQDTAREAFLRKGFKAVSMREISRLSGVGLSNIYNYYGSSEILCDDLIVESKKS
jgi:Transcriptional regulator